MCSSSPSVAAGWLTRTGALALESLWKKNYIVPSFSKGLHSSPSIESKQTVSSLERFLWGRTQNLPFLGKTWKSLCPRLRPSGCSLIPGLCTAPLAFSHPPPAAMHPSASCPSGATSWLQPASLCKWQCNIWWCGRSVVQVPHACCSWSWHQGPIC